MAFNSTVAMTPTHLHNLLRLPPTLRCLLRPLQPIPTMRNFSTRSAQAPQPLPCTFNPLPTLRNLSTRSTRLSRPFKRPSSPSHATTKPPPPPPSPRRRFLHLFPRTLLWTLLSLLTYLPIFLFTVNHIGRPMRVTGISMYPFLNTDSTPSSSSSSLSSLAAASQDRVWVSLRNPYEDLHRGDVVVFWSPRNPEHKAVKRVVGLEGDIVEMREGSGLRATGRGKLGFEGRGGKEVTVPVGHIWVEGEHPEGARWSLDSNTYGPIPIALLVGKVKAVYWPWEKAGWVRWQDWKGSPRVREGRVEPVELYTF